jgi:hypothetical protein
VGATGTVVGVVATAAAAGTLGYLWSSTQDPAGDPAVKQAYLDYNQPLGIAAAASGAVLVLGSGVLLIGLIAE